MNKEKIIKLLGAFFIIVGGLQLILNTKNIWWSLVDLFHPSSLRSLHENLLLSAACFLVFLMLPVAIFIAGFGILKIKKWGWRLAMASCIITLIINFYGTINFAINSYKFRNLPIPTISESVHVVFVSMWPTYIEALISALLIMLLIQKSIKNSFNH
jgi:hypothetical protein